jgi:hypothetical protein
METNPRIEAMISRWRSLRGQKDGWRNHADDIARVMLPRRAGFSSSWAEGTSRVEEIYDGTPMQAARGLANAVAGLLRPDGFVSMRMDDDAIDNTDEAQAWLGESNAILRTAFENPKARMRQATGEVDLDLVTVADAFMFVGATRTLDNLLFMSIHPKDCVAFFGEQGNPEGVFREVGYTVRQLISKFGINALSEACRKKADPGQGQKLDDTVRVLHAVVPREEGRADALMAKNLPFADIWIEIEAKHELKVGGFHELPYICPRWDTSSGESSGRSPGMIALPDANTLQSMGETILITGQRQADPPLMAPNDGTFDAPNTMPGGMGYYDVETAAAVGGNPFFPLEIGGNLAISRDMQDDTRRQIFAAFYRNILNLPVDGPAMTATEIIERKQEFLREVGPVFGRLESDYTAPMVERAFNVILRNDGFPEIPPAMQGKKIVFEYESPVKTMRQQIEAASAERWVASLIEVSNATQRPDILDVVNFDAAARFSAEAGRVPPALVNPQGKVDQIRDGRAKAQQEAAQAEQAQQIAQLADQGAGAMSKLAQAVPAEEA